MGLLVLTCFVCMTILPTLIVAVRSPCFPYTDGQYWSQGNSVCFCRDGQPYCEGNTGHCIGYGDIHYKSIDGKRFDFQGLCRYVLIRNCCMARRFTIEVEQIRWRATRAAVSNSFTIRFGRYRVVLRKPNILEVFLPNNVQVGWYPFFNNGVLRCERLGRWMYVTLKNRKVWFRWDYRYSFDVWVSSSRYRNKLCGLCGDFNGRPGNDLKLTPYDEKVTNVNQWGDSWRVARHNQPGRCRCSTDSPPDPPDCTAHTAKMNECNTLMTGGVFTDCNALIDPAPYIKDCRVEMCECAVIPRDGCLCLGASGYVKACEAVGLTIDMAWTEAAKCPVCKDAETGIVYQDGETWTYECKNKECKEGVVDVTTNDKCCKVGNVYYMENQVWVIKCNKYKCVEGNQEFIERICCYYNDMSYELGSEWQVNQCRKCVCHLNGTVTCTFDPITCPTGFELTDSCCCLPPEWIDPNNKH